MPIETAILLWVTGALVGSMVFFGVVVAPKVFQALTPEHAGIFLRALFPRYYLWGLAIAGASTAIALWASWPVFFACAAVLALFAYARQLLMPKINAARDAQLRGEQDAIRRFDRLHLRSVLINGLQLLVLLAAAALLIWSR
jgi:hypothetical protein